MVCVAVLHHLPDAEAGLRQAVRKLKRGGGCPLYLYYDLDHRGPLYRGLCAVSDAGRRIVSRLPRTARLAVCDAIALFVYAPLVGFARMVRRLGGARAYLRLPLAYYVNKSATEIRTDALDRFGSPLERRFTREQMAAMMMAAGLAEARFSPQAPFWHAFARWG